MKPSGNLVLVRYVLCSILCLLLPISAASAAPAISNLGGTFNDGQTITVSGVNFGSNSVVGTSSIEWLGGAGGPTESGTAGASFSRARWSSLWGDNLPTYVTDQHHDGSKSIKATPNSTSWDSDITYALPSAVNPGDSLYLSWWVRMNHSQAGQWKMLRISGPYSFADGVQELVFFYNNDTANQMVIDPGTGTDNTTWTDPSVYPQSNDTWYRMELIINASTLNTGNGTVIINRYLPGSGVTTETTTNLTTHRTGYSWNYLIWQNYCGNGMDSATFWFDDIFIQKGTQARIELCDTATWSSRTHCEIQYPTSWNNTSAQFTLNTGSFTSNSTAYLFVVDANGNASSGGKVTLGSVGSGGSVGGSSGGTLTPKPPQLGN